MSLFRSLTFLGTSSGVPTLYRNISSYCLSWSDGAVWMFDCGESTQHQLLRCQNVSVGKIEKIFITHMHGDHCWGLPGLMCSLAMMWQPPGVVPNATFAKIKEAAKSSPAATATASENDDDEDEVEGEDAQIIYDHFSHRSQFLEIYGPPKIGTFLREVLRTSEARFGFQYRVHEIVPTGSTPNPNIDFLMDEAPTNWIYPMVPGGKQYDIIARSTVKGSALPSVQAAFLDHRVFSVGYAVTEPTTPGALDMKKVTALGIPKGPLLSKLKNGESIEFVDPKTNEKVVVNSAQVVGADQPGRIALCLGDTCNSDATIPIASGAEWVVHESTFDNNKSALAIPRGHSTAQMAGLFAQKLNAKNLVLTHFSARYPSSAKDPTIMEALRMEAQVVFQNGPVFAADDFSVFDMVKKKKEN